MQRTVHDGVLLTAVCVYKTLKEHNHHVWSSVTEQEFSYIAY